MEENELDVFYHHYTALGWRRENGRLPASFRALLAEWRDGAKARISTKLSPTEVAGIQARLKGIDDRLAELKRQTYQPYAMAPLQIKPEALTEMAQLQAERSKLLTFHG